MKLMSVVNVLGKFRICAQLLNLPNGVATTRNPWLKLSVTGRSRQIPCIVKIDFMLLVKSIFTIHGICRNFFSTYYKILARMPEQFRRLLFDASFLHWMYTFSNGFKIHANFKSRLFSLLYLRVWRIKHCAENLERLWMSSLLKNKAAAKARNIAKCKNKIYIYFYVASSIKLWMASFSVVRRLLKTFCLKGKHEETLRSSAY